MAKTNYSTSGILKNLLLLLGIFSLLSGSVYGQCVGIKDPASGLFTTQPSSFLRCPALNDPIPGTVTLTFQTPVSNITIDWGNGDIQTYPGPLTSLPYTYTTAQQFRFRISIPGCPDSLKGTYVNERNLTAAGVSVPGVGFIVPPAGITNKRCVPEDLTITNGSPGMNGYTKWVVTWGDGELDTLGSEFFKSYTHQYQKGTAGCSLQICVTYLNGCGVNPVNRPRACYGDYFFKDIDSAIVTPASIYLCEPVAVTINDNSKLNCLDSADRELLWTRTSGFGSPLPFPGDNVFRPYNVTNRRLDIPASAFFPIPVDSTYSLKMVIRNTCGDDSADAVIRIVSPTKPVFSVLNNNTCPGETMNFHNSTSNRPYQSYQVDFGDGTVVTTGFQANFSHIYLIGGTYTVKMTTLVNGYNGQICSLSDSITVQVKTTVTPIVNVTPKLACDSLIARIENNSINTTGAVWGGWELGGSPLVTAGSGVLPSSVNTTQMQVVSTNLTDSSAIVKYKMHGRYIIKLKAQSLGCPQIEDADTIEVYPSANIRWKVSAKTVCLGNSISIRDSSSVLSSTVLATMRRSLNTNWNHISWSLNMGDGTIYQSNSNITSNFNSVQGTNRLTTHTYTLPGNYMVKLTVRSPNRCPKIDSVLVTVLPSAVPAFKFVRDSCNPGIITLRNQTLGSSQRYVWTIKRGTSLFSTETRLAKDTFSVSLPYFPPGDSTFYYVSLTAISGTSPDTCASTSAPLLIKIPPAKQAAFSISQTDGCTPLRDLQIINQSIGIPSDGSHVYHWTFGNGNTFTGENPPLQNYINNGTGFLKDTIRLRITSGSICVYTAFKVLTIYPKPNPIIVAPAEVCHNSSVSFSATGNGIGAYEWNFNEIDGTTSSQPTPVRTLVNTGSTPVQYTIGLIAASVAGCVDTVSKVIVVNPLPTASFTANPEAACGASPIFFDATSSVAADTYSWNFSDGTSGIQDTNAATVNRFFPENISTVDKSYIVTLNTKTSKGCVSLPFSKTVRIRPTVRAAFAIDNDSACNPLTVNFINLSTQTDNNYTWYVNELGAPGLGIPNPPNRPNYGFNTTFFNNGYTSPARYVVTLVVKDDNGSPVCESSFSDTLTVLPKPLASFIRDNINPSSLCSPTTFRVIPRGSQGANSYTWDFGDGSPTLLKNDTLPIGYVYSNNGVSVLPFNINLIVSNGFGCTDTATQTMNIRPQVTAAIQADNFIGCSPLVSNLTNNSSASSVSYTWFRNDVPVFFNRDIPVQTFLNNSSTDSAFYKIYLVARGAGDVCADTSSVLNFTVLPKPVVQISASPSNGCSPLVVSLSAVGTTGGQTFAWSYKLSSDTAFTSIGIRNNSSPFTDTLENSSLSPVNYVVKVVVTGPGGCKDSAQTNVTVFPDVVPAFTQSASQGCSPLPVNFFVTSTGPVGTTYVWKINGVPQFDPTPLGFSNNFISASDTVETIYSVSLQAISPGGCIRETATQIRVFPQPSPDFNQLASPTSLCSPVSVRFFPNVKSNVQSLTWVFGSADSLVTSQDTAVTNLYVNNGPAPLDSQVVLKVKTINGCSASVSKIVRINPFVKAGFSQSVFEGCSPLQVTFTNDSSSVGANSFEWFVDGILVGNNPIAITQTLTNGSSSLDRLVSIRLVARNAQSPACSDTAIGFVRILPNPDVSASAFPFTGCSPLQTSISAASTTGGSTFRWFRKKSNETVYLFDTLCNSGNPFFRTLSNLGSNPIVYNFKLVVEGAAGCRDSSLFDVTVYPQLKSAFSIGPDSAGCAPFSATMANSTVSPAANTFAWLIDGIQVSNSPAFLNQTFENASSTTPKEYLVQLVSSNASYGCPDTASKKVIAYPLPLVDFSISRNPLSACSPVTVAFNPLNISGADTLVWVLNDTLVTTQDTLVSRVYTNNSVVPQTRFASLTGINTFGCSVSKTSNFQINPGVVAGVLASGDSLCSPAQITFTNTSSTGVNVVEWYVNGVFRSTSLSSITETLINLDSVPKQFTIRLVAKNSLSPACRDTSEIVVTILPKPMGGNLAASIENGCSPLSVLLTGTAVSASHYFWDFGDGTSFDTTSQIINHVFTNLNPVQTAEYSILQISINDFGCSDSASIKVRVRPNVSAGIIASDSSGCTPLNISLSGSPSVNANSYSWDFGDGNSGSGVNVSRIFSNTSDSVQTYRVRLIADRISVSCPDTAYLPIRVFPLPIADFEANPVSGCQPLAVHFVSQAIRADSTWWVIGNGGLGDTIAGNNSTIFDSTFTNSGTQILTIKAEHFASTVLGCNASTSKNITVSPFVNADFGLSADSGCSPLTVNLSNLSAPGAAASWFVDGNLVSNSNSQFNFNFVNTTQDLKVFRVLLQVSNVLNSGCTDTISKLVRVFPKPVAGILGAIPDNGCSPLKVDFFSNALGATRFLYDFNDGIVLDTNQPNASHIFINNASLTTRSFTTKLVVSNDYGCSDNTVKVLNVKPTVKAVISAPDTLGCTPFSSGFSGLNSVNSNMYNWDFGNGASSQLSTPVKVFQNSSDSIQAFTIRLITDRSGVGCPDTAFAQIKVLPKPVADLLPNPLQGCNPLAVSLTNLSTGTQSSTWTISGNGLTESFAAGNQPFDTVLVNSQSNLNLNVDVSITALNQFGCSDTKSRIITVAPFVQASFSKSADSGCSPLKVRFVNQAPSGNLVQWLVDGQVVAGGLNALSYTFVNNGPGVRDFVVSQIASAALANDCQDTTSQIVRVFPKPQSGILNALPDIACSPARIDFIGSAVGADRFQWSFGDGSELDTTSQEVFHIFNNSNSSNNRNFNVRLVAITDHECTDTSFRSVTIRPLVKAGIFTPDSVGCTPFQVTFSAAPSVNANQFQWDFGNGQTSTLSSPGITFTNSSDSVECHRVRLIASRNGVDCADTAYYTICVNPAPVPQFNLSPESGCQPLAISVQDNSIASDSTAWQFISGGFLSEAFGSNYDTVVTNSSAQIKTVRVILNTFSAKGCRAKLEKQFTVSPFISGDFSQTADSGCSPLKVDFINLSSLGNVPAWYIDGIQVSASSNGFSYNFVNNGNATKEFEVMLVVRANLDPNCTDTLRKKVIVYPKPVAGFVSASPESGCSPLITELSAQPTLGIRYIWDFKDGTVLDSNLLTVNHTFTSFNPSANTIFDVQFVTITEHGCTDTSNRQVSVSPFTIARIGLSDSSGCTPLTLQLVGAASQNANQFVWNFGDGSAAGFQTNPEHTFVNGGQADVEYTVRLIATRSGFDCPDTAYRKVLVHPAPLALFSASPDIGCGPLPVLFTGNAQLADSVVWNVSSIYGAVSFSGSPLNWDSTFSHTQGSQQLVVRIEQEAWSVNGCKSTFADTVRINPDVKALFSAGPSGCTPAIVQFSNQSINPGGSYLWDFGDGSAPSQDPNPAHIFNYSGGSDTTFNVVLTAVSNPFNSPSCNKTFTLPVQVSAKPRPDFTINPAILQLPQTVVNFSNLTPYRPNWTYEWKFGDNSTGSSPNFTVSHDYSGLVSELSNLAVTVWMKAISPQGCVDSVSHILIILPVPPVVDFQPDTQGCSPLPVAFRNYSKFGNSYEWNFGDGSTSTEQNPVHVYQTSGKYTVTLKVTGPGGTTSLTRESIIEVFGNPIAEFTPDYEVEVTIPNEAYVVKAVGPPPGENWDYQWNFGDGGTGSGQNASHIYNELGAYTITLTVTSDKGCVNSKTIENGVRTKLGGIMQVPNAFIPSNIPENEYMVEEQNRRTDIFYPFSKGTIEIQMEIFNRWGELIFQTQQLGKGWNGWYLGRQCKSDVYVYKIWARFSDGRAETFVGDVTLIR